MCRKLGDTFQTGDTEQAGVTRFLLDIPVVDSWFRSAILQAILLMTNEQNWYKQGDISPERAAEIASEAFSTARFEDVTE